MDSNFQSEEKLLSKKNLISLLLLAILIVGIPLGVRLAQRQQQLKSQAAGDPIKFSGTGVDCSKTECITTSPTIDIELISPLGPPGGEAGPPGGEAGPPGGQ